MNQATVFVWPLERVGDSGKRWVIEPKQFPYRVNTVHAVRDGVTQHVALASTGVGVGIPWMLDLAHPVDSVTASGVHL